MPQLRSATEARREPNFRFPGGGHLARLGQQSRYRRGAPVASSKKWRFFVSIATGTSAPSWSWTGGGEDATRFGRAPTTVSSESDSRASSSSPASLFRLRASILKYAIDSPP